MVGQGKAKADGRPFPNLRLTSRPRVRISFLLTLSLRPRACHLVSSCSRVCGLADHTETAIEFTNTGRMELSNRLLSLSALRLAQLPSVQTALSIGRGGGAAAAAALTTVTATESALSIAGGGGSGDDTGSIFLTPQGKSVLCMAMAMACHYLGYSLARPITVALFTSASTGYKGFAAAFPFAMAFVSPAALLILTGYNSVLERHGPRGALMRSTLLCSAIITLSAISIIILSKTGLTVFGNIPAVKLITGPLFIFRESYVQLITSQYWSFMASVLTPNQSARWFGPIAGLTSITSAVAGLAVSPLVDRIGLPGTLLGTALMLLLSLVGASQAYDIAERHGFSPTDTTPTKNKSKTSSQTSSIHKAGMIEKATHLFARVPVLWVLFQEILASQALATVLNVCFVARLGTAIPDDSQRAGWVGMFFALINVITMVLQFGVLPPLMTVIEPKDLWRAVPVVSLLFTGFQALQKNPSLYTVSASLLVMKVSEYSARRMLDELVYVPLDFESRFLGKEVIGVLGYRFGKSIMSLALSGMTQVMGNFGLQELSMLSTGVALAWLRMAWRLSNFVPTQQEAEDAYEESHNIKRKKK